MDFSYIDFDDDQLAFWAEVSAFFDEHATEDVLDEERRTGSGFSESLHKALGERGWVMPTWSPEEGGAGLDPVRNRILRLEMERREVPTVTLSTTNLVVAVVRAAGTDELKAELLPKVASGDVRFALGYTEPDGGSDLAGVRTRATRSDDGWLVNGAKMFTTGAQNCQYAIMVTRTDPDVPKHRGITIFLVPLDSPGVEIQAIHTLGGERTNAVFFDDVFVADDHRLGPVNEGWRVLASALAAEHGEYERDGLEEISGGHSYNAVLRRLLTAAAEWARTPGPDGRRPFDNAEIRRVLAEVALDVEINRNAPEGMGRILASDNLIKRSAELLDAVGPVALLPRGADGAVVGGVLEAGHRFAQGTAIYGGTTDIARNIIAQHTLGLPRPPKVG